MILVGTSGFSYKDWVGRFYPDWLKPKDMLTYYAEYFRMVELDFTYYQMPGVKAMAGLAGKVPEGFHFCVKAHRTITHEIGEAGEPYAAFRAALEPLAATGKLGCVLAQFPWSFKLTKDNVGYIARLRDEFEGYEVVVEFRNSDWLIPKTFQFLRKLAMGFCCVDEPQLRGLLPPLAAATSDTGYVRFHGRNAQKWWTHDDPAERYDYLYSEDELKEWLPKIAAVDKETDRTYVLFNNHRTGQAAQNAKLMQELMDRLLPLGSLDGEE